MNKKFFDDAFHFEECEGEKIIIHYKNGDKTWFNGGKRHRIDGPAVVWKNSIIWYLDDVVYSFDEWLEEIEKQFGGEYAMKMKLKWSHPIQ